MMQRATTNGRPGKIQRRGGQEEPSAASRAAGGKSSSNAPFAEPATFRASRPEAEEEELGDVPCDTLVALQVAKEQFHKHSPEAKWALVLRSQIYSIIKSHTVSDRELDELRRANTIRVFKLPLRTEDYALMLIDDYERCLKEAIEGPAEGEAPLEARVVLDWFCQRVLSRCTDMSVSHNRLIDLLGRPVDGASTRYEEPLEEKHVNLLLKCGCIRRQHRPDGAAAESYWFAIPGAGPVLKEVMGGRKELVSLLKRRRYPEILQRELEKKKLRASGLGIKFHVQDLAGTGHFKRVPTSAGILLRLSDSATDLL